MQWQQQSTAKVPSTGHMYSVQRTGIVPALAEVTKLAINRHASSLGTESYKSPVHVLLLGPFKALPLKFRVYPPLCSESLGIGQVSLCSFPQLLMAMAWWQLLHSSMDKFISRWPLSRHYTGSTKQGRESTYTMARWEQ